MHFVPGSRPHWLSKADATGPDALVIDLEDSVARPDKPTARTQLRGLLNDTAPLRADLWVRTVDADDSDFSEDLEAAVHERVTGIMLPKSESAEQVHRVSARLAELEAERGLPAGSTALIVSPESPKAVSDLCEILGADRRVIGVGFPGADGGDLANSLGISQSPGRVEVLYIRSRVLFEARLAGCQQILEGVWVDIEDADGFQADCELSARLGYTGRATIHPGQVAFANEAYGPSAEQMANARGLLAAYQEAVAVGQGATKYRGRMVDAAMVDAAQQLLARASQYTS